MAEVKDELKQETVDVETVKKELETSKVEAEKAKTEAEAARKETEALKEELEKLKTKKGTGSLSKNNQKKQDEEMVTVFLIKTKEKKDDFFCAINGHTYQIKRGEYVQVPKAVQEIIKHQNQMDQIALENMEKANKNFA